MKIFSFPERVNEYAARLVATFVLSTMLVGFFAGLPWVFPLLSAGFLLRVGWGPRFSPYARLAMFLAGKLWAPKPVTGAPKRFAQGIGAVCMVTATTLWRLGHVQAAWAVGGLIVVFASLEAFFAFCAGCWMYAQLQRAGIFPPEACIDCVPAYLKQTGT